MEHRDTTRALWLVGVFAMAMGFVEAAVVVYLRLHFHPQGFDFPLALMPGDILMVEVAREAATLVMLATVGWLAGRSWLGRLSYFGFAFAVWDLFYYIFLRVTVNWPASLLTNDVLFLIPIPWIAPVLAPVLCSVALITASILILRRESRGTPIKIRPMQWVGIISGGALILASFLMDTGASLHQAMPGPFPWILFGAGLGVSVVAFFAGLNVRQ